MAVIIALALVALLSMAALGVDFGYMAMVQGELQKAADAGALAGGRVLGSSANPDWSTAQAAATAMVQQNKAGGELLTSCQVDYGYWSKLSQSLQSSAITPQQTDVPAIQVTIRKAAGINGGPVQLLFAPIFGKTSHDLSARAIAMLKASEGVWSILETGHSSITLNSNININGSVGDNGSTLIFNSNVTVQGKVYLNTSTSLINNGGVAEQGIEQDSGSNTILSQAIAAANTQYTSLTNLSNNTGTFADINSNTTITGTHTVNVVNIGNLLLNSNKNLTLSGTSNMSFVVRVSGTFILNSNSNVNLAGGLKPGNVTFVDTGTSGVIMNSNCTINGSILTQKSSVTLNSNATLNGSIVGGQSISLNSDSVVTPPQTFMPAIGGSGQGAALVQ